MSTQNELEADRPLPDGDGLDEGEVLDLQVFERIYPVLRRYAAAVAPIEVEPDDLVQDALVRALAGGSLARVENPEAYLKRAIVNQASNSRRGLGRRRAALTRLSGSTTEAAEPVYPSEVVALLQLCPVDRAILYLADVEAASYQEIGAIVGLKPTTARGRASRARAALRRLIQSKESDRGN